MSKKIFCLVLTLMMVLCSTAFAAVPSKTATDVTADAPVSVSGVELGIDFAIVPSGDDTVAQTVLDMIANVVNTTAAPVVKVFGEEAEAAIAALLPEGVDAADLELAELFEVYIQNYDESYGDVKVAFHTLTAANTVAAVFGIVNGEEAPVWVVLETEVVDDTVVVTFTADAIAQAADANTVLAFLNTPEAE